MRHLLWVSVTLALLSSPFVPSPLEVSEDDASYHHSQLELLQEPIFALAKPVVKWSSGSVEGDWLKSRSGRNYVGFINYFGATLPVDEVDFKVAHHANLWQDTQESILLERSLFCPSTSIIVPPWHPSPWLQHERHRVFKEDYLKINVFTPAINHTKVSQGSSDVIDSNEKLSVMVRISEPKEPAMKPDCFIDKNVILVTVNYGNAGVVGFRSSGDKETHPRNLKDHQSFAVEWVKENIIKFGGNSELVTIIGTSNFTGAHGHCLTLSSLSSCTEETKASVTDSHSGEDYILNNNNNYDVRNSYLVYSDVSNNWMIFDHRHLVNGLSGKVAISDWKGGELCDFYLYNEARAEELILYLPEYTKVSGSLFLDNKARVRLVAPNGISITGADFNDLEVIINTYNLKELERVLLNSDKEEFIADSTSWVTVDNTKGQRLWIEACRVVLGGENILNDLRAVLHCSKHVDDYSFTTLKGSVLSSTFIEIADSNSNKSSLGVKLEGDISSWGAKFEGNNSTFQLDGMLKGNQASINAHLVSIGDSGSIKLVSYKRSESLIIAPGGLSIGGVRGLFAPNSKIHFVLHEVVESLKKAPERGFFAFISRIFNVLHEMMEYLGILVPREKREYRNYSCYSGGICLNHDISWLFGNEEDTCPGNATISHFSSEINAKVIDEVGSLPFINIYFVDSLEMQGRIEGESGVSIAGKVLKLLENGEVSSKSGAVNFEGTMVDLDGKVTSGYIDLMVEELRLLQSGEVSSKNGVINLKGTLVDLAGKVTSGYIDLMVEELRLLQSGEVSSKNGVINLKGTLVDLAGKVTSGYIDLMVEELRLLQSGEVSSKNGVINLKGTLVDLAGKISSDHVNLEAKDLITHTEDIETSSLNIHAVSMHNIKHLKLRESCITLAGKLSNDISGVMEFSVSVITAEDLLNEGVIKSDYLSFKISNKLENKGEISNLSDDPEASLEFLSSAGSFILSEGTIRSNMQVKFESKDGTITVNSIVVGNGNIYLFGSREVISHSLEAKKIKVTSKNWQAKNVKSDVIDFTNDDENDHAIFSGKIHSNRLLVTAQSVRFTETSNIAIENVILNVRGTVEISTSNPSNKVNVWAQEGGDLRNRGHLIVGSSLYMESNAGSFTNQGSLFIGIDLLVKVRGTFENGHKLVAGGDINAVSVADFYNEHHIESTGGNIYIKSEGASIFNWDGNVDHYRKILSAETVHLIADGKIFSKDIYAKEIYLKADTLHNFGQLESVEDMELHVNGYENHGSIQAGEAIQFIDDNEIGQRRLCLQLSNNIAAKQIYFEGKEWILNGDLTVNGDLSIIADAAVDTHHRLEIKGNLELKTYTSVLNRGYWKVLGDITIITKIFTNFKYWDATQNIHRGNDYRLLQSFGGLKRRNEPHRDRAYELMNTFWRDHDVEEYDRIDTGRENTGEVHGNTISIIADYYISNNEGSLLRSNAGIKLMANDVNNMYRPRRNGLGVYGNGFELVPGKIETVHGDIVIHANAKIHHKGSDIVSHHGRVFEYAKGDIVHELVAGAYAVRQAQLPQYAQLAVHQVRYHLSFDLFHVSIPANVYAAQGFFAFSEHGAVVAHGAHIGSFGDVVLKGKDVVQKPALVGNNQYIGGIAMGKNVGYEAENNLDISGVVMSENNMFLKAGNVAYIAALQHAYLKKYVWTRKHKEIIYGFVLSEVQLIAGGAIEVNCGAICHLSGAYVNGKTGVSIRGEKVVTLDVAHMQQENYLYQKKRRLVVGSSKVEATVGTSSTVATSIHSEGDINVYSDHTLAIGLQAIGKKVNIIGKESLRLSEFSHEEKMTIRTKRKGIWTPKLNQAMIRDNMQSSYLRINDPSRISIGNSIIDSFKSAKSESMLDLHGPLSLSSDVLMRAQQMYSSLRSGGVSPEASLAKTMLALVPSVNLNFGTIKNLVKRSVTKTVITDLRAEHIRLESGGDAEVSGTQVTATENVEILVKGDVIVQSTVEKVNQEGEVTISGPTASINFNGLTVAFTRTESDYSGISSTHIPSFIIAPNVTVVVDGNLTLRGAFVQGEKVDVYVAKNLLIESVKNVNSFESDSSSVSLGVTFSGGLPTFSGGLSASESSSHSELVGFISGISGSDVSVVAEKIHLKGAEIFGSRKLVVDGVVSTEDLEEVMKSSSYHMSVSFDMIKEIGTSSINSIGFGAAKKYHHRVVHSGIGRKATSETTNKNNGKFSFMWSEALTSAVKSWYTTLQSKLNVIVIEPAIRYWLNPDESINGKTYSDGNKLETDEIPVKSKTKQSEFSTEKIEKELVQIYGREYVETAKEKGIVRLYKTAEMGNYKYENRKIIIELPKEVKLAGSASSLDLHGYKIALDVISEVEAKALRAHAMKFGKYFIRISPQVAMALTIYEVGKLAYDNRGALIDAVTFTTNLLTEAVNKGTILSTPIHKNKGTILSTPTHENKGDILIFPVHEDDGSILSTPIHEDQGIILSTPATDFDIRSLILLNEDHKDRGLWSIDRYDKVLCDSEFGLIYRDSNPLGKGNKRIWWSKDTAGHGKCAWKMFEEGEKGLHWTKDVDKYGNYMENKHKGPIGKFLPWKRLRSVNIKKKKT